MRNGVIIKSHFIKLCFLFSILFLLIFKTSEKRIKKLFVVTVYISQGFSYFTQRVVAYYKAVFQNKKIFSVQSTRTSNKYDIYLDFVKKFQT